MSTGCSPRTTARVSTIPPSGVFDALMAEPQFADPIAYAAQPYLPNPPALPTRRPPPGLSRRLEPRGHAPRAARPGRERGRRRDHLAHADRLAGAGARPGRRRGATCASPDADLPGWADLIAPSTGVLTTGTFEVAPVDDPCELPPTGGYRGLENQLYRVEIHDPGQPGGTATFKWSRENASVGSRVASIVSATELELATLGRDDVLRSRPATGSRSSTTCASSRRRPARCARSRSSRRRAGITVRAAAAGGHAARQLPQQRLPRGAQPAGAPLGPAAARSSAPMPAARRSRCRISTPRARPASSRCRRGHDAACWRTASRSSFASTGAKGFARATTGCSRRAPPTPRSSCSTARRRAASTTTMRGSASGTSARARSTDCRHPWPPTAEGHDCSCTACVTARVARQRPVHHPGRREPGGADAAAPSAWAPASTR